VITKKMQTKENENLKKNETLQMKTRD